MDRLDFCLPDFFRLSWVSPRAEHTWAPRIARISAAWSATEWASVGEGLREAALLSVAREDWEAQRARAEAQGLILVELARRRLGQAAYVAAHQPASPDGPFAHWAALTAPERAEPLRAAYAAGDDEAIGAALGYPGCCRDFFRAVWVDQRQIDTTWPMALASPSSGTDALRELTGPWQANILLRWLGVRAAPHLPCRFDCAETVRLADRLLALMRGLGFVEEAVWTQEMLDWPVSWSALHGAAEVHLPVLRFCVNTDATARRYGVNRRSDCLPAEAAVGLDFPYRIAPRRVQAAGGPWSANGFADPESMRVAHAPIVRFCENIGAGRSGIVLDMGCGDGALLEAICAQLPGTTPAGVDRLPEVIALAKARFSGREASFACGELEAPEGWWPGSVAMALLMPGRLLEPGDWRALRARMRSVRALVVYAYGDWLAPDGLQGLCQRAGLALEALAPSGTVGLATLVDLRPADHSG